MNSLQIRVSASQSFRLRIFFTLLDAVNQTVPPHAEHETLFCQRNRTTTALRQTVPSHAINYEILFCQP
jgi:hypothetical protein